MKSKYKIIITITLLLVILSVSISIINYFVSLKNTQEQLKTQSLPLSLDNIYTEIQKHIVEPYLVSSMMANDTFVQDWLQYDEHNQAKIVTYLDAIKNKYEMLSTFLVSDKTKSYFTQNGFIEIVKPENKQNQWYFDFIKNPNKHEINIDFNEHIANNLIMFINYKIFDNKYHYIGTTGVALKISYINDMLKSFRQKYGFKVMFFDENGKLVLAEYINQNDNKTSINDIIKQYKDKIISKNGNLIEFNLKGEQYLINTKYIPELNLYLAVEAKLDNYTQEAKHVFYFNLAISLFITLIISLMVFNIIKKYNKKLEFMAYNDPLTHLYNRRQFEIEFLNVIKYHKRTQDDFCITFIDIDNFKEINDIYGHKVGDTVLQEISSLLKHHIRETDIIARWGGEEIVILLLNTDLNGAKITVEKLRSIIENDVRLKHIVSKNITASFGVTQFRHDDDIDSALNRADEAMYSSKSNGKNQVTAI